MTASASDLPAARTDDGLADDASVAPKRARRRPRQETSLLPQSALPGPAKRGKRGAPAKSDRLLFDIAGVVLLSLSLLVALALLSYRAADLDRLAQAIAVANLIGPGGAWVANVATLSFGVVGFLAPVPVAIAGWLCLRPTAQPWRTLARICAAAIAALGSMTLLHTMLRNTSWLPYPAGGLVGASLFETSAAVVAPLGTGVVALVVVGLSGLVALEQSVGEAARAALAAAQATLAATWVRMQEWWAERQQMQQQAADEAAEADALADEASIPPAPVALATTRKRKRDAEPIKPQSVAADTAVEDIGAPLIRRGIPVEPLSPLLAHRQVEPVAAEVPPWSLSLGQPIHNDKVISLRDAMAKRRPVEFVEPAELGAMPPTTVEPLPGLADAVLDEVELKIVERPKDAATLVAQAEAAEQRALVKSPAKEYQLPPLHLLDYDAPPPIVVDEAVLRSQADKLIAKFLDFGIDGRIREIRPGPVVTTYEFIPAPGIKVSKVAALADDIAMAMEAVHVRIVAPIPGKGAIGIEIPNERRETVFMKEIIADPAFRNRDDKLLMALGKDIEGKSYYSNLADMPHVLIAGTTGSGKSVSVNAMICSILYRATPDDVKFLMIDPKMLELSLYDGIPHLLLPPIIDSKKAAVALKWAVAEMERRYQMMSELGVRDLKGYNDRVLAGPVQDKSGNALAKLPFIVVIIDEYADLLAVAGKDVEAYVMRLAQKARAAGLHVMLATQRPSVDVITGVIKANFPVRMGFRLASNHDSKTIINQVGAEKLLGRGDMLFMPPGTSNVLRVHGAYLSERELHKVVAFLKEQGKPNYDMSILTHEDEGGDGEGASAAMVDEVKDARFDEAVQVVARTRKCSTSWLQRAMNLGYQRAARIVDRMEREGMVGAALNAKGDRDIFLRPDGSRLNGIDG